MCKCQWGRAKREGWGRGREFDYRYEECAAEAPQSGYFAASFFVTKLHFLWFRWPGVWGKAWSIPRPEL